VKYLLIILLTLTLQATSTLSTLRTFTQSDGTTFEGRLQGDAFMHWIEAKDKSILLFNKKTGNFEYAIIKDGDIILSGNIYNTTKVRSLHQGTLSRDNLKELWKVRHP
jgi:hypothetical protein